MKKKIKLSIFLVLSFLLFLVAFSGCGNSLTEQQVESYKQLSETCFSNLQQGNYQEVYTTFSDKLKKTLSQQQLQQAWLQTIQPLGAYQQQDTISVDTQGSLVVVTSSHIYEKQSLEMRLSYNKKEQLEGIYFTYQENSGEVQQTTLPQGVVEEEITITADEKYPLSGTLTMPQKTSDSIPVLVLVQGSGQSDRDETIYSNKPFRDIAWGLAQQGIASLRYDKRYYTYAEEVQKIANSITVQQEITDDALAALELVQNDARFSKVFLLGHSQGGMLMPYLAAQNGKLAGAISMAGSLRSLWEIMYDQNIQLAELTKNTLSEQQKTTLSQQLLQLESDVQTLKNLKQNQDIKQKTLLSLPVSYWISLEETEGKQYISQLQIPLLILQGEKDFQVYADIDYPLWQETLEQYPNATFHLYPNLNHLMMPSKGGTIADTSEYAQPDTVDSQVITDIAQFIHSNS